MKPFLREIFPRFYASFSVRSQHYALTNDIRTFPSLRILAERSHSAYLRVPLRDKKPPPSPPTEKGVNSMRCYSLLVSVLQLVKIRRNVILTANLPNLLALKFASNSGVLHKQSRTYRKTRALASQLSSKSSKLKALSDFLVARKL